VSGSTNYTNHESVLLQEVLACIGTNDSFVLDCTFGAGGYSKEILSLNSNNRVVACDCDHYVLDNVKLFKNLFADRFAFYLTKFSQINQVLPEENVGKFDVLVLDLGVSSMQLDIAERGFSFGKEAKLDMRMDDSQGCSAYEVVNNFPEEELANIIFQYGEEHDSRKISRKIVENRQKNEIVTTSQLAEIVQSVIGYKYRKSKINPATKTFQALRIFVNDELAELKAILELSKFLLKTGGKLIVVSFHSLEDRIVKNFLSDNSGLRKSVSRITKYIPSDLEYKSEIFFKLDQKKIIRPQESELNVNPRARSARLRSAIRL